MWATITEQADKLSRLRALTLSNFALWDDVAESHEERGEKLRVKVEEVARRCPSLEYVSIAGPGGYLVSPYQLEFRIHATGGKGEALIQRKDSDSEQHHEREVHAELEDRPYTGKEEESWRHARRFKGEL